MKIQKKYGPMICSLICKRLEKMELIELERSNRQGLEKELLSILSLHFDDQSKIAEQLSKLGHTGDRQQSELRKMLAKGQGISLGDDAIEKIITEISEHFMESDRVEEVYGEDLDLRREVSKAINLFDEVKESIENEIRSRLRNLEKGTSAYNMEFSKRLDLKLRNMS